LKTRGILFFSVAAAVLALGAGVWLLWPGPAITEEAIRRIRLGMTRQEVQEIIGLPRDENGGLAGAEYQGSVRGSIRSRDTAEWLGLEVAITIYFENDRVAGYQRGNILALPQETLAMKLRRLLGL
jgi:hypothetical protein